MESSWKGRAASNAAVHPRRGLGVKRRPLLAAALVTALTLTGCGGGGGTGGSTDSGAAAPVGAPKPGGTAVLQLPSEITNGLNPLISSDPTLNTLLSGSVYGKLIDIKVGPNVKAWELEPDLAESWEVAKDGKSYTFKLRKDVRWHNIAPVNGRGVRRRRRGGHLRGTEEGHPGAPVDDRAGHRYRGAGRAHRRVQTEQAVRARCWTTSPTTST